MYHKSLSNFDRHLNHKRQQGMRHAFTLVELLIVVAIIAVLISILLPAIAFVRYQSHSADAIATINTVHMAIQQYAQKTAYPLYPDNPPDTSNKYVGFLKYAPHASNAADRGILSTLSDKNLFTPATEDVDEDGLMLDPWGEPFHYVKGNFANRIGSSGYDATKPQDLNKPKDTDLSPKDSDWNIDDKGGFTYIYSTGDSTDDEDWIYIKDLRGDY